MSTPVHNHDPVLAFRRLGYRRLEAALSPNDLEVLEREYAELHVWARRILEAAARQGISLAEYYRGQKREPIVVLESGTHAQVCRFERLAGTSLAIDRLVSERLRPLVEELVGERLVLFKDKCNLKLPGGGAFPPHQDARAYRHFGPSYYATAMLMLDDADERNGCLEVAHGYREATVADSLPVETPLGAFLLFPSHDARPNGGDLVAAAAAVFEWQRLEMRRGEVVVFDSFLPHRSAVNASTRNRRALFFTFNLAGEGDFYERYYRTKSLDYGNPIFHVATPTLAAGPTNSLEFHGASRTEAPS